MIAYDWNFLGLSLETKPMTGEKVVDGSTFYECDTCDFYIFYQGEWYKQTFVTEDGINVYLYKSLMKKMFGKFFDSNITKAKLIKPDTGTNIEFTTSLPAQIIDLTGYGDSEQQTYSGKNLFDSSQAPVFNLGTSSVAIPTGVRVEATEVRSNSFSVFRLFRSSDFLNKTITLSMYATPSASNLPNAYIGLCDENGTNRVAKAFISAGDGKRSATYTHTEENASSPYIMVALYANSSSPVQIGDYVDYTELQLEISSTATDYEPYVGGVPAPNPQYPQDVQVVTGEQTVSDGTNSESYTVNLGTTELCKIGDYQDYIYKSGDDWYVHKEIGKIVLDGSDDEGWIASSYNRIRTSSTFGLLPNSPSSYINYANQLINANSETVENSFNVGSSSIYIKCTSKTSSVADWKTWVSSNNLIIYAPLATPTDTKITDNTLISQLDALLEYTFPAGVNTIVITADELPMPLKLIISEKE